MGGKKYPQDRCEWLPEDGIRLLKDNVDFSEAGVADLRIETLNLYAVFGGLYTKYIPQLPEHEQNVVTLSWERLRTVLENLPRKKMNLPKMKLLELPKQVETQSNNLPAYLERFQTTETRELVGARHVEDPEISNFQAEIKKDMDVAIFTESKSTRPWLGRVIEVKPGCKEFVVHWFQRRSRSLLFHASMSNGAPSTSILSTDSVMLWNFTDRRTADSFELSQEWFDKIMTEYSDHDLCYA